MKIGYPCINRSIECQGGRTFRLKSYSGKRLREVIENNLRCLWRMLEYNEEKGILFFRISSDLIPFASHPVCKVRWQKIYKSDFQDIGKFIKKHRMRISMHPDQFTLINSQDESIFERSVMELSYHADVLDLLGLGPTAKIQIHVGGVYGDKETSLARFVNRYALLPASVRAHLVIENDERCYNVKDCLSISDETGLPVLFDSFHNSIYSFEASTKDVMKAVVRTWGSIDGIPMVDYSSQEGGAKPGAHAQTIDIDDFAAFLRSSKPFDFDIMLEIKDKEVSALKAIAVASKDRRFLK